MFSMILRLLRLVFVIDRVDAKELAIRRAATRQARADVGVPQSLVL